MLTSLLPSTVRDMIKRIGKTNRKTNFMRLNTNLRGSLEIKRRTNANRRLIAASLISLTNTKKKQERKT